MENIVSVTALRKSFKNVDVLRDVSFTIPKGGIFALLGSNGAGKTTTVRILATLSRPDGGSASICGYDVVRQADCVRGCISLTGQFAAVDEVLTGKENLQLMGRLRRLPHVERRVERWLGFFHLEDAANRRISTYSGGMRRRLDIAMSLMDSPQVLFLDEPTTGLDPQSRLAMWDLVKGLATQGTTIFLTTQYLEEAEYLADEIAILHGGTIIAHGTPQYLKEIMPQRGTTLGFPSDEKAEEAMKLLQAHGISVDSVARTLPSLEEVFLSLIGEKKEGDPHA